MTSSKATNRAVAVAVLASLFAFAPAARADKAKEAKEVFTKGRDLAAKGRCVEAIEKFKTALELLPSGLGSLLNIAICEEKLGHFTAAKQTYAELKEKAKASKDPKYQGWDQDADEAIQKLLPQIAHVTIQINGADASRAHVTINHEVLPSSAIGREIDEDPGTLSIEGASGSSTTMQVVTVAAGEKRVVTLELKAEPDPFAGEKPAPEQPSDPASKQRTLKTAGWVAIGVGAAGAVGAAIAIGIRQSALSKVNSACPSHNNCDPALESTHSRGAAAGTAAPVLGTLAVAGIATGTILLVVSGSKSRTPQSNVGVSAPKPRAQGFFVPLPGGAYAGGKVEF